MKKRLEKALRNQLLRQLIISLAMLALILVFGTIGFVTIDGADFLDALYMTVITITTVGYGEVVPLSGAGKMFTIVLIFLGAGFVLHIFTSITEAVVEGGLEEHIRRMKMKKKVARLSGHYIVCGFGRIGRVICKILAENDRDFVVVERNPHKIQAIIDQGHLVLEGESADDQVLKDAGIENARGLIAVVSSDADTVYITLSARGIRPDLFIMARSSGEEGAETKLLRAGADKVLSPYFIGATRMAQQVVRPTVIDFIDLAVGGGELGLRMEEMTVSESSRYADKTLMDSGIRKDHDLIVVAMKRNHGQMIFNPNPDTVINPSDIMVVLGNHKDIKDLEKEL